MRSICSEGSRARCSEWSGSVTVRACQRGPVYLRCPSLPSTQYYPARLFSPSTHVFPLNQLRRAVLSGRSSRRVRWRPALHVFPVRLAVLTFLISHDCGSRWRCHRLPFDGPEAPAGEECAPTIPVAESRRERVGRIRQRRSTRRRNLRRCAGLRCASPYDDGRDHQRQRRDPADAGGTPSSRTRPARSLIESRTTPRSFPSRGRVTASARPNSPGRSGGDPREPRRRPASTTRPDFYVSFEVGDSIRKSGRACAR